MKNELLYAARIIIPLRFNSSCSSLLGLSARTGALMFAIAVMVAFAFFSFMIAAPHTSVSAAVAEPGGIPVSNQDQANSATVTFSSGTYRVTEGQAVDIEVFLNAGLQEEIVILIERQLVSAGDDDYWGGPGAEAYNLVFAAGETTQSFLIGGMQDTDDEPDETFILRFGSNLPSGVSLGSTSQATVTIVDDDFRPVKVEFESDSYRVEEGHSVDIRVTLDLTPDRPLAIPVYYNKGSGLADSDFYGVPSNVSFGPDETSKTFTIHAVDNSEDLPDKSLELVIGTRYGGAPFPNWVSRGTNGSATVTLLDNDLLQLNVSMPSDEFIIGEGGEHTVVVTLTEPTNRRLVIPIGHEPLDGGSASDYSVTPARLTFNVGDSSQSLIVASNDDDDDDPGKRFRVFLDQLPAGVSAGQYTQAIVSVTDDDFPIVEAQFEETSYTAIENSGNPTNVTLVLDRAPERSLWIPFNITYQGGASGDDFSNKPWGGFSFGPHDTEAVSEIWARADSANDDGESLLLTLNPPDRVTAVTPRQTTVHLDDRNIPEVNISFAETSYEVTEGQSIDINVEVDKDPERSVTVSLNDIPKGDDYATRYRDYTITPSDITFFAGGLRTRTFTLTAIDDTFDEADFERLTVSLYLRSAIKVTRGNDATVRIADNDLPIIRLNDTSPFFDSPVLGEGDARTFSYKLSETPIASFTVPIEVTHGTNITSGDYSLSKSQLSFGPTQIEDSFILTAISGDHSEYRETLWFELGTPTASNINVRAARREIIIDDPNPPVYEPKQNFSVYLQALQEAVEEGDEGSFVLSVSSETEHELTATLTVTHLGGATSADYEATIPTTFILPVGFTSKTFPFKPVIDELVETGEQVRVTMTMDYPDRYFAGSETSGTIGITDFTIGPSQVAFRNHRKTVTEGESTTIYVDRTGDLDGAYTIEVRGAAAFGVYTVSEQLEFARDESEKSFTFTAPEDADDESNPSVTFEFVNLPSGVTAASTPSVVVTVDEDDFFPGVRATFSMDTYHIDEGATETITINLNHAPQREVKLRVSESPARFITTPIEVTAGPTDTNFTFEYTAPRDNRPSDTLVSRLFMTSLSSKVNIPTDNAYVRIANVDPTTIVFTTTSYNVDEGDAVDITVELDKPATQSMTIPIIASSDQAVSSDYSVQSSVVFSAGDEQETFSFNALDDEVDDGTETVTLNFGSLPNGIQAGEQGRNTSVQIADDPQDVPQVTVKFEESSRSVLEGSGFDAIILLAGLPERSVTVPITVEAIGGAEASDYEVSPTSVTFNDSTRRVSVSFQAKADDDVETGNQVRLGFGPLPNAVSLGTPSTLTIFITDPDVVDSSLDLGGVGGHWLKPFRTAGVSAPSGDNTIEHDTCAVTESFIFQWTGNNSVADEFQVLKRGDVPVTYNVEDRDDQNEDETTRDFVLKGEATFTQGGFFSIGVRAKFGGVWSPWSGRVTFYCNSD